MFGRLNKPESCINQTLNKPESCINQTLNKPEPCINQTLNKPESCINQTLNKPESCINQTLNKPESCINPSSLAKGYDSGPLLSTLGRSRIHFEDSRFNISLVTATSTRIQSEDVLHGVPVIDEM